jgi:hypothetical protein
MDLMNAVIAKEKKERKHLKAALPKLVKDIAKAVDSDGDEELGRFKRHDKAGEYLDEIDEQISSLHLPR